MHNAVMCKLSLYDVIRIKFHLHIKLKSFSNIAQPLHKEAVRGCSFLYIIAKKSVIMSEAFLVDVSISSKYLKGYKGYWANKVSPIKFIQGRKLKRPAPESNHSRTQHTILTWYTCLPNIIKISQKVSKLLSAQAFVYGRTESRLIVISPGDRNIGGYRVTLSTTTFQIENSDINPFWMIYDSVPFWKKCINISEFTKYLIN